MKRENYQITLDAPKEKVWSVLWDESTYPVWTSVFSESSRAETDWAEGSKVLFLNGNNDGMVSEIAKNIPREEMHIRHLGIVKNGVEDTASEEVAQWAGAMEIYKLKSVNGKTELTVEMDVDDTYGDFFRETWPKALEEIRRLTEEKSITTNKL